MYTVTTLTDPIVRLRRALLVCVACGKPTGRRGPAYLCAACMTQVAVCSGCQQLRPLAHFNVDRARPNGHTAYCNPCRGYALPDERLSRLKRRVARLVELRDGGYRMPEAARLAGFPTVRTAQRAIRRIYGQDAQPAL